MQEEIWKDIPGYEGYYQISDLGNVRSIDRVVQYGTNGTPRFRKGSIMKPTLRGGYLRCGLCTNGFQRYYGIHQLIAMAFLNHTPAGNTLVVDHINNIPTDNRLENLQLVSHRYNASKDKTGCSKHTGVGWHIKGKKWQVRAFINGKHVHLGLFKDEREAAIAYQNALKGLDELIPNYQNK